MDNICVNDWFSLALAYYLNVSLSVLITWVWKEKADFSAIDYSQFCCFHSKEFPHPLGA